MKFTKPSFLALLLCLVGTPASATTLTWDAPTQYTAGHPVQPGDIAWYTVHFGSTSGAYTRSVDVTAPSYTYDRAALGLPTEYFAAVTARTAGGERSAYSNEVWVSHITEPPMVACASPAPVPSVSYVVRPLTGSTTRPVYDLAAFRDSGGVTRRLLGWRVAVGSTCGAAVSTSIDWRQVTGVGGVVGVALCVESAAP